MRKILSIMLSIIICYTLVPNYAKAEPVPEDINVSFVYTNTGVTASADGSVIASTEQGWAGETSGNGFFIDGTTVTIDAAGKFNFSGSCNDGNIFVPKGEGAENRKIEINLEGLNLTEPDEGQCPIEIKGGTNRVEISAKKNTQNILTDANHNEISPKACINASKKLVIKGKGELTVNGNNKNGIKSDTKIEIKNLDLNVNSVSDAIKADEEVYIESGDLVINTGDDAIKSDEHVIIGNEASDVSGEPQIDIQSSYEGIEGVVIDIFDGNIKVKSSDDGINAARLKEETIMGYDPECQINISGGNLYLIGGNDGLDSNGDITLTGGNLQLYTTNELKIGNAALDMERNLHISGATVFAADNNAGLKPYSTPTVESQRYFVVSKRFSINENATIYDNGNVFSYIIPVHGSHYFYSSPTLTEDDVLNQNDSMHSTIGGVTGGKNSNIDSTGEASSSASSEASAAPIPTIKIAKPTINKIKAGKKSFTITWKKVKNVDGYQLQYSTSKTFKKSARKTINISKKKTSYTVKKMKAKKKYYVRMRGYKLVDGKRINSAWASVVSIKTRK